MTSQVIPVEAVEAAAEAAYGAVCPMMGFPATLEHAPSPLQETYRGIARAALEAAAAYMLESAYEQGWEDGREGTRSEVWWQK